MQKIAPLPPFWPRLRFDHRFGSRPLRPGLAFLNFVPQGGTLGTNSKRVDPWPVFDLWYWIDAYPHVVDMLRNEKPVFFTFDDTIAAAILKTEWEPPGELEPPQPP